MSRRAWISLAAAVPLAVACSSGGGGGIGGGAISTSVSGTKPMESLSSTERSQWCHDVATWYAQQITPSDTMKSRCYAQAISAAYSTQNADERRQKCSDAYHQCLSQPPATNTDTSGSVQANCEQSKTFFQCKATVSQVGTCLSEEIAMVKSIYASYDTYCDSIGVDAGTSSTVKREEPASCTSIEAQCPGLGSSSTNDATASDSAGPAAASGG